MDAQRQKRERKREREGREREREERERERERRPPRDTATEGGGDGCVSLISACSVVVCDAYKFA